jgi:tetratricopeptide (TPR) repeat protein
MTGQNNRLREVMTASTVLMQQDEHQKALELLDQAIAEAIRDQAPWVSTLCHHAAVIADFAGSLERQKDCYEQSLGSNPENARALYGLAKIADEQGKTEIAKQFAIRCHKAITEGKDEIVKAGLLDLLLARWPELAGK